MALSTFSTLSGNGVEMGLIDSNALGSLKRREQIMILETVDGGTSDDNVKIIKLRKAYDPEKYWFKARKFERWPDEIRATINPENHSELIVQRVDVSTGGWGERLLIDVLPRTPPDVIPRDIYQTFSTKKDIPKGMKAAILSWAEKNPSFGHYLFDNEDRIKFIKEHFPKNVLHAYLDLIPGALKADLWRCCVLYENGGVYADADMICLRPLSEWLDFETSEFVTCRDDPMSKSFLCNGFMASKARHPFLKAQIDAIVKNVEERRDCYYLEISGPGLLGKTVNSVCGRNPDTPYILGKDQRIGKGEFKMTILYHNWKTKRILTSKEEEILVTEYDGKNDEMKTVGAKTYYELVQNGLVYRRIPRKIYITAFDTLDISPSMMKSFKSHNPHWEICIFLDEDMERFFRENKKVLLDLVGADVSQTYSSFKTIGERVDFWRYCVIYLNGGVYVDLDTHCMASIDSWVNSYDLILGLEANLSLSAARQFGMDRIGIVKDERVVSICNWAFAASPKNKNLKNLIFDICTRPMMERGNVLVNTGPGRLTRSILLRHKIFPNEKDDLIFDNGKSIIFSINRFGSNQSHSGAYKNYKNSLEIGNRNDIFIVHLFEGTWKDELRSGRLVKLQYPNSNFVAHNISVYKKGKIKGVSRIDHNTSRTRFMETIGDCRSFLQSVFNDKLELESWEERKIEGLDPSKKFKFEDFRSFNFHGNFYFSVSYIDEDFNTRVGVVRESDGMFLGNVTLLNHSLNKVGFVGSKNVIWEKNWLFFNAVDGRLVLIYSTTPRFILFECKNFEKLEFQKLVDMAWPLDPLPKDELYFTASVVSSGGSTNPIYIPEKKGFLYLIHTKNYASKVYNNYGVLLHQETLKPISMTNGPLIDSSIVSFDLFFPMSLLEDPNDSRYLILSGGVSDRYNFVWKIKKSRITEKHWPR